MTEDIPDDDYETPVSKVVTRLTANNSFWDAGEVATILLLVFLGVQIFLGEFSLIPAFAGLFAVWYAVAKVADTRVDQRIDVRDTGWAGETTREDARIHESDECAAHGEDGVECRMGGQTVRSYDVFRVGGYEVARRKTAENTYCENHFAIQYPSETDREVEGMDTEKEVLIEEDVY